MPRIQPLDREQMPEPARTVFDRELARFGRLTNMNAHAFADRLSRADGVVSVV